jgi:hypothetical protein
MKHFTRNIILLVTLLFFYTVSFSQSVTVRASANKDKIIIGEPIEVKLDVQVPTDAAVKWFPLDSIPHFEFIDKGKIDTVAASDGIKYLQTLTITSFDSGRWHIAALPLEIGNKNYLTDSLPVSIGYSDFDNKKDYHDIKEILEVEAVEFDYINWILGALALLSLLMIIYFLRKKVTVAPAVVNMPVSKLNPLQEALEALNSLNKNNLTEAAAVKTYHTRLNDILRRFLYRKTGIATMEKTSGELMVQLKGLGLPTDIFTQLAQTMRMNDAVKFAKFQPDTNENEGSFTVIKQSIEELDKKIS